MWEKIKYTIVVVLATLGVLFIVLMLWPEDDEATESVSSQETAEVQEDSEDEDIDDADIEESEQEEVEQEEAKEDEADTTENEEDDTENKENSASVSIPASEVSDKAIKFRTVSLNNEEVTQDIFSDYDITVVHVWGTYCQPCISEMGDYAKLYKELPDNVNLIAVVCDVYDGIDNNVSSANDILSNAGAKFTNLRTSDDLYDVISGLQYVPSSFFVDSKGHLIGEMMDGASFSDTKARLEGYLK